MLRCRFVCENDGFASTNLKEKAQRREVKKILIQLVYMRAQTIFKDP